MSRLRRRQVEIVGVREASALTATLGAGIKDGRAAMGWRQVDLGARVGMSQSQISKVERGQGGCLPFASWVSLGLAVKRPLRVELSRPLAPQQSLADTGHLAGQEFVLRLAALHGWRAEFEFPTRALDPARSIDVLLRDDLHRRLLLIEIWNQIGDLGAGARSSDRKLAEARALAVAVGGDVGPYAVALLWLLRPTAANRQIVRSYPAIFRARFPGSSLGWVTALERGEASPDAPGIAWIDPDAGRLVPMRIAAGNHAAR